MDFTQEECVYLLGGLYVAARLAEEDFRAGRLTAPEAAAHLVMLGNLRDKLVSYAPTLA